MTPQSEAAQAVQYRLAADTLGAAEIEAAKAVLDSGQLTMGQEVRAFELEFAEWVGIDHAVMVNSGSSANLLMVDTLLRSTDGQPALVPGDEVIVPGLSWPTTVWPIAQLGLIPVFVDVDATTLAIDLASAAKVLSPRTRAMFLIHPLGRAVDLTAYAAFCTANNLVLLEDCCESLGAHWEGAHVGTVGAAASFSFYFSHHVSTVEGGMVVTDDPHVADDLRGLRAHGWVRDRSDRSQWVADYPQFDPRFLFASLGYNVRATEIQASIGRIQLERLDEMLRAREWLAAEICGWLATSAPWLEVIGSDTFASGMPTRRAGRIHSWMTLPLRLQPDAPVDRNELVRYLESNGVETRPIIAGNLARHPATATVAHRQDDEMAVSDALLRESLMIGCHPVPAPGSLAVLQSAIAGLSNF